MANRRYFDQRLATAWQAARRDATPLAVVMIDVDFFKRYNDHYGHQAGDACLRAVSAALCAVLMRPNDLLARYGGEEFACLLPGTGPDGALVVGQALCRAVEAAALPHGQADAGAVVTISVGVAAGLCTQMVSAEWLVSEADRALYEAKRSGRARAVLAG